MNFVFISPNYPENQLDILPLNMERLTGLNPIMKLGLLWMRNYVMILTSRLALILKRSMNINQNQP